MSHPWIHCITDTSMRTVLNCFKKSKKFHVFKCRHHDRNTLSLETISLTLQLITRAVPIQSGFRHYLRQDSSLELKSCVVNQMKIFANKKNNMSNPTTRIPNSSSPRPSITKTAHGNISGTKRGIIDPLVSKRQENVVRKKKKIQTKFSD